MPLGEWRFWQMKWRRFKKWHKWRKIARGLATFIMWQIFKLDAKSGPLESGDFGKIGEIGNYFAKDAVEPVISKQATKHAPNSVDFHKIG